MPLIKVNKAVRSRTQLILSVSLQDDQRKELLPPRELRYSLPLGMSSTQLLNEIRASLKSALPEETPDGSLLAAIDGQPL